MIYTCGWIGTPELIVIVVAIVLLFGGKKIPELAKGLGRGIKEFKKTTEDSEIADNLKDIASEISDLKKDVDKMNPKKILQQEDLFNKRK